VAARTRNRFEEWHAAISQNDDWRCAAFTLSSARLAQRIQPCETRSIVQANPVHAGARAATGVPDGRRFYVRWGGKHVKLEAGAGMKAPALR
jgi:hypothetical protein